jgi:hypothetical protein
MQKNEQRTSLSNPTNAPICQYFKTTTSLIYVSATVTCLLLVNLSSSYWVSSQVVILYDLMIASIYFLDPKV